MKPGYSIIELTIGIFLASLLAITLFQSVRNTTTTVELADDIMDLDMRVSHFHNQFERDTVGIFIPEKHEVAQAPEKGDASPTTNEKTPPTPATAPAEKDKASEQVKPQKLPDKLFYSVNSDTGQVTEFTFITSNPVRVYEKAANVTLRPRMVRVMYRLIVDPNNADSFSLFRQESQELDVSAVDPKSAKPARGYALINNIKKLSFDFLYPVKPEPEKQQTQLPGGKIAEISGKSTVGTNGAKPDVEKIEKRSDWPFKTLEEAQEKKVPAMPQIITAKLELWDESRKSFREFTLNYPIASFTLQEKKKKKRPAQKPVAAKPQTGTVQNSKTVELHMTLRPKTEQRLKELGEKVFKIALPEHDFEALKKSKTLFSEKNEVQKIKGAT